MQFRILLVFLLTSLAAAFPLLAPKKTNGKTTQQVAQTTKAADPTTKAPVTSIQVTSTQAPATTQAPVSSKISSVVFSAPSTIKSSSVASSHTSSVASSTSAPVTTAVSTSSTTFTSATSSTGTNSGSTSASSGSLTSSASQTSSASSSSASASSTALICGLTCGTKTCSTRSKTSKRAEADANYFDSRSLKDVSASQADPYVLETIKKAGSTAELDYTFASDYAVSRHGSFANKAFPRFVTGLEGCTGVAVVSEKGYWMSHFMEEAYQPDKKTQWASLLAAVTTGNLKYTKPDTLTDLFQDANAEIYVMRPRDGVTNALLYDSQTKTILDKIQTGILSSAKVNKLEYKKPKNIAELDNGGVFETTARGKMLIEYDNNHQVSGQAASPQQAVARVFLESTIYNQKWAAKTNQLVGAADEQQGATVAEHRATCLKDDTKTLTEADVTAAFDSVFKTTVDVSSPVSQTGTSGDVKVQINIKMSASQTGCKVGSGRKIMKTMAKRMILDAAKQCPKLGSTTEFLGSKPDIYNTAIGCLDIEVYKV